MNIPEVDQPENYERQPVDWETVLFGEPVVKSEPTNKTLKDFLPEDDGRRFHDMSDFDEYHDERTVDAVVGVGDSKAEFSDAFGEEDERPRQEPPDDEEIDAMYEASQTEHTAYITAH